MQRLSMLAERARGPSLRRGRAPLRASRLAQGAVAVLLAAGTQGCEESESPFELVFREQNYSQASISPDGSTIVYQKSPESFDDFLASASAEIMVASPQGESPRVLARGANPVWSPTSEEVAFDRDGRIYICDVESGGMRSLDFVADVSEPSWSPSGTHMVLRHEAEDHPPQAILVSLDGSMRFNTFTDYRSPVWNAAGTEIAVSYEYLDVYVVSLEDPFAPADKVVDLPSSSYALDLAWNPHSSEIAYVWTDDYYVPMGAVGIVDRDTEVSREIFPMTERVIRVSWTPDGEGLVVEKMVSQSTEIWIHNLATGEAHRFLEAGS